MDWFLYDIGLRHQRVKGQFHKVVKDTQTICRLFPKNSLSMFDHFVVLALKELKCYCDQHE